VSSVQGKTWPVRAGPLCPCEVHHAQLIISGNLNWAKLSARDKVLSPREHLLEEVLGNLLKGRHIILSLKVVMGKGIMLTMLAEGFEDVLVAAKASN
jgi:hypothetical protein